MANLSRVTLKKHGRNPKKPFQVSSTRTRNAKKQNGCLRRPYRYLGKEEKQKAEDKGKIYLFECRVPKNSKER